MSNAVFENLLIIELASVLAGPSVGKFFAELGAEVIKIENPDTKGDVTRTWKGPKEDPDNEVSAYFSSVNWGKKSLVIDLKKEKGKAVICDLIKQADIVLTSYKPGDAEKLNMDYKSLSSINPSLIYGQITAYGPDDPRPGFDAVLQAETGFTYMNGNPSSGPVKMPVALIDVLAAHQLKEALLIALIERSQSGKGSLQEVSLFHSGIASLVNQATNYLVGGMIPQAIGSDHPNIVPYGTLFNTGDNKLLVIAVGSNRQFRGLCEVLGLDELPEDERFNSNPQRVKNRETLILLLRTAFEIKTRAEWINALNQKKVPVGEVRDMAEVFEDPAAAKMMLKDANSGMTGVSELVFRKTGKISPPPRLNADEGWILGEKLGYSDEDINLLRDEHVIQ